MFLLRWQTYPDQQLHGLVSEQWKEMRLMDVAHINQHGLIPSLAFLLHYPSIATKDQEKSVDIRSPYNKENVMLAVGLPFLRLD